MSGSESSPLATSDFDEIEGALSATARGRAFLREHAARSRGVELGGLLHAIARLERQIGTAHPALDVEAVRDRVAGLRRAISGARAVLRASPQARSPAEDGPAPLDLAAIGQSVVMEIVSAAEVIQETTWIMREAGLDADLCDRLDAQATAIYAGCARHDEIGRRLAALDSSLGAIAAGCDALARATGKQERPILAAALDGHPIALTAGDIAFVLRDEDLPAAETTGAPA